MERDFEGYHKTIYAELQALKDRVRFLIGGSHWLSDGEHKEAIVRHILKRHIPEHFRVGQGFVVFQEGNSTQIDVLVTDKGHPTLFKEGSLQIVSPDAVRCILEIKTRIDNTASMLEALVKLSDNVYNIRREQGNLFRCDAALFVFEDSNLNDAEILDCLQDAAQGEEMRVVNLVSVGSKCFVRYWSKNEREGIDDNGPCWAAYDLSNLAPTYFLSNIVVELNWEAMFKFQDYWFPSDGGKEMHRTHLRSLVQHA